MITRFAGWVNEVNTTSFRIVISIVCTAIGMFAVLVAIMAFNWQPTEVQIKVLEGMVIVALTMMGFDVLQFIGKRFTDASYAAAKSPSPVNVEAPSTVAVTTAGDTSVGPEPTARSAAVQTPPVVLPLVHRVSERGDDE